MEYAAAFLVVILIDLVFFCYYYFSVKKKHDRERERLQEYQKTAGRIVRIEEVMNMKSAYPVVLYDVHYCFLNGTGRETEGMVTLKKKGILNVGDEIAVYYDSKKPGENLTDYDIEEAGKRDRLLLGTLGILPVVILLFALSSKFL